MQHYAAGIATRHAVGPEGGLQVGRRSLRPRAEESAGIGAGGQRPLAEQGVFEGHADLLRQARHHVVVRHRLPAAEHHAGAEMVLQVFTDAGQVADHRKAEHLQLRPGPDPGQLEDLGRIERAAGDDHFATRARHQRFVATGVFDARGDACVDDHPRDHCVGHHGKVRAAARRVEVGRGGARAKAAPGIELVVPGALLPRAVEIVVGREAGLRGRGDERVGERMRLRRRRNGEFGLLEPGLHVLPAPTRVARVAPAVVVLALPADVQHAVDRAGAADHAPAGLFEHAAVQRRLGRGRVHPVIAGVAEELRVPDRDLDPRAAVFTACFQQQHAMAAGLGQAGGQHAARGARACDDEVEFNVVLHGIRQVS